MPPFLVFLNIKTKKKKRKEKKERDLVIGGMMEALKLEILILIRNYSFRYIIDIIPAQRKYST